MYVHVKLYNMLYKLSKASTYYGALELNQINAGACGERL